MFNNAVDGFLKTMSVYLPFVLSYTAFWTNTSMPAFRLSLFAAITGQLYFFGKAYVGRDFKCERSKKWICAECLIALLFLSAACAMLLAQMLKETKAPMDFWAFYLIGYANLFLLFETIVSFYLDVRRLEGNDKTDTKTPSDENMQPLSDKPFLSGRTV